MDRAIIINEQTEYKINKRNIKQNMKNCKSTCERLIFLFNDRAFEIDFDKFALVLKKLNIPYQKFKAAPEFGKFLKQNGLLIEEFLEFVSF